MKSLFKTLPAVAVLASTLTAAPVFAQNYPDKPVTITVGMAPGGSNDTVARMISAELQTRLKQPFVVENKPGANSTIATAELARATPDGSKLMLVISSHVTNTLLYPNLNYTLEDFKPVAVITETPFALVANNNFEPNTVKEFIEKAKSMPAGSIDFGTPGIGSTQHIAMELMDQVAGIKMNHVPYKGGAPAQADLLGGVIPVIFATPTQSLPFIQSGQLKAIGVTSQKRLPQLPDVPTFAESGLEGYESSVWYGVIAPKDTPDETVQVLNKEIVAIVNSPSFKKKLDEMGLKPVGSTPEEFQQLIDNEEKKWAKVIKDANIKVQ